jgi:thioredoxin reductase (NADPH)
MNHPTVTADVLFVGAGPIGLYGAYYAGFRNLSVAVVDLLPQVGGQVSTLYPEKMIYDVAGFPAIKGHELIDNLRRQADKFAPRYLLGEQAVSLERDGKGFRVTTSAGTTVRAGAIVVTAGVGAASPRPLPCGEEFLGRGVHYFVPSLSVFDDKDVIVVGGGDSAVDWALAATERARSVALVHRRRAFRAHEHSVELLEKSDCELILDAEVSRIDGGGQVSSVSIMQAGQDQPLRRDAQVVVAALGFTLRLGPIEEWGLAFQNRAIVVDEAMRTNVDGVFAAGDIATHAGKVKLISVGFGEVATAVNHAAVHIRPGELLSPGHSSDAVA